MPETRPISDRINLAYVKRKHWPQTSMFRLSLLAGGLVVAGALALEAGNATGAFAGHAFYTSGDVTHAHSMFGNNCAACHVADVGNPGKFAFNKPVNDAKCLECHETYALTHSDAQSKYNGAEVKVEGIAHPVRMSSRCADCHVEHQGYDYNLNRVSDGVCTQCHTDMAGSAYAPGRAPAKPVLANVTSFAGDHPEWAVLRNKVEDTAAYNFGHKTHNNPDHPGMQDALRAIKNGSSPAGRDTGRAVHIDDRAGKLSMSCTYCHEVDAVGAYMKPIRFDVHCVDCHTGALGTVGVEGSDLKIVGTPSAAARLALAQAIPHGSSRQVADVVDKAIGAFVLASPPVFTGAPAEPPADEGGGRRRRGGAEEPKPAEEAQPAGGRRRGGGGDAAPAAPEPPKLPTAATVSAESLQTWSKEQRVSLLGKLNSGTYCTKCHTDNKPGPAEAPELFSISDRKIPSRWLPMSHFGHTAHAMVSCVECHTGALTGDKTSDVMLPTIASCRDCHASSATPSGNGAAYDCNLCHTYHDRRAVPASIMGRKTIEQVRRGGAAAPKAASTGTAPKD